MGNGKKFYNIEIWGSEDSTEFKMGLTDEEFNFMQKLRNKAKKHAPVYGTGIKIEPVRKI